jgi:hypothetical protein
LPVHDDHLAVVSSAVNAAAHAAGPGQGRARRAPATAEEQATGSDQQREGQKS